MVFEAFFWKKRFVKKYSVVGRGLRAPCTPRSPKKEAPKTVNQKKKRVK
jgi:hypothetical protein